MEVQFKNKGYEKFISTGSTASINQSFAKKLRIIYHTFASAEELNDISSVRYLECHELKGDRKGEYAVSVNGPWRVVFKIDGKKVYDVDIENYH
ncbi:type II toxin-antitoxin system RelE/ParE family toxin [Citrobacter freundii]|nr:type II toxin-antitoxin system RelE/ParE family toxin [Citrobacter freundii]HCW0182157.1 type II toxin-antitoxin system RelE/ParE family toxin [Citrobacter freundii]